MSQPPEKEPWFFTLLKWTFFIVIGGVVLGTLVIAGTCALMSMR